jgi:hypothetical protein
MPYGVSTTITESIEHLLTKQWKREPQQGSSNLASYSVPDKRVHMDTCWAYRGSSKGASGKVKGID